MLRSERLNQVAVLGRHRASLSSGQSSAANRHSSIKEPERVRQSDGETVSGRLRDLWEFLQQLVRIHTKGVDFAWTCLAAGPSKCRRGVTKLGNVEKAYGERIMI